MTLHKISKMFKMKSCEKNQEFSKWKKTEKIMSAFLHKAYLPSEKEWRHYCYKIIKNYLDNSSFLHKKQNQTLDFHYSKRKSLYKSYYVFMFLMSKTRIYQNMLFKNTFFITIHTAQILMYSQKKNIKVALILRQATI